MPCARMIFYRLAMFQMQSCCWICSIDEVSTACLSCARIILYGLVMFPIQSCCWVCSIDGVPEPVRKSHTFTCDHPTTGPIHHSEMRAKERATM